VQTYILEQGIYHTYAVDGALNLSVKGTNSITVLDVLPPDVYVQGQTISNAPDRFVNIRSSDNNGYVYLVMEGVPMSTKQQLDAAVGARKGQKAAVGAANTDTPVSTHQLMPGNYRAVAVDIHGNPSANSSSIVMVTMASHLKLILEYSFSELSPPAAGQIIGTDIFVKVPVGTPLNALVASFTLTPLATAFVGLVQQNEGFTPNNFTNPVIYTIEAEDGTTVEYTVTVSFGTFAEGSDLSGSFRMYPNPVADRLIIELPQQADRIQVVSVSGQEIMDIPEPGSSGVVIDASRWMRGSYLVRIYRSGRVLAVHPVVRE
jgi:hypothetical protein